MIPWTLATALALLTLAAGFFAGARYALSQRMTAAIMEIVREMLEKGEVSQQELATAYWRAQQPKDKIVLPRMIPSTSPPPKD